MDNYRCQLKEMFALPINLQVADIVDGKKLYTSDLLKKNFLLSIKQTDRTKLIYSEIEKLVNRDLIIPCFKHKGFFGLFKYQFFGSIDEKSIAGFFHPEKKKIFVLIDNSINKFGFSSNDMLSSTTIHECMHLFYHLNNTKFMSIFFSTLRKFYLEVFNQIFKLESKPKDLDLIIKFISKFELRTIDNLNMNKELTKYHKLLKNTLMSYSKLDENSFMKVLTDYIVSIKIYFLNFSTFMNSYNKYQMIFMGIGHAYKKAMGGKNKYTMEFQELISISEPICVLSEIQSKHSKIIQAFKKFA